MTEIYCRPATVDDAEAINGIYNPFVRDSVSTFELDEHSTDDRRRWIEAQQNSPRTPVFVAADVAGAVCGFSSANPFDPRGAYETSVKTSVFVDPVCHGMGAGARLYEALFEALGEADLHRAYALIVAPNPASVALHEGVGFRYLMTLSEVGRKFGRYYDVMWFEKQL